MPEYLAPGVYIEEVSFRAKSIEGVSTSITGFIGPTRYGPTEGEPELLTSFTEFERIFGGIDRLAFDGHDEEHQNYMAHAVRAFFDNGGSKLYVVRTYKNNNTSLGLASSAADSPPAVVLQARFKGQAGNMTVSFGIKMTGNLLVKIDDKPVVRSIRDRDVLFVRARTTASPPPAKSYQLYDVKQDGDGFAFERLEIPASPPLAADSFDPTQQEAYVITLSVRVRRNGRFENEEVWDNLAPGLHRSDSIHNLFTEKPESRIRYLTVPFAIKTGAKSGAEFLEDLFGQQVLNKLAQSNTPLRPADLERTFRLTGGTDGILPDAEVYSGKEAAEGASGLKAFENVEEISMLAAPGYSFVAPELTEDLRKNREQEIDAIVQALIMHCQIRMRYRVALLDSPNDLTPSEVRTFRSKFDSTHAALYYPWVTVLDPLDRRREINVPPCGFVAGICARTDVQRGVFKAPANEVVLGAIGFEKLLNKAHQDVLNPEGINAFRFFEGRGFRLWGARTISSDPEWKYLSVRRYFAYLERSVDKGTQWAVFENNNESLWANIRRTVEDFLFNEWRNGALMGTKPEEAYFVRCNRATMTQNDLDNGRLICEIGVSVVKPAEFVIFRIGQWTAGGTA